MANARYVDTGGQQVDRDGNARVALVLVLADQLFDLVTLPGDDLYSCLVVILAVNVLEGFVEKVFDPLGMGLVNAKNHRFFVARRVELLRQLLADDLVETGRNHAAIERLDFEVEFVLEFGDIHLAGARIDDADALALGKVDAILAQQGLVADWRFVINQPVVSHGLTVAVGVYRSPEDLAGVLGWGRGEPDAAGVEIVEHATILR